MKEMRDVAAEEQAAPREAGRGKKNSQSLQKFGLLMSASEP